MGKSGKSSIKSYLNHFSLTSCNCSTFKAFTEIIKEGTEIYQFLREGDSFFWNYYDEDTIVKVLKDDDNTVDSNCPIIYLIFIQKDIIYGGLLYTDPKYISTGEAIYRINLYDTIGNIRTGGATWTFIKELMADHNNSKKIDRLRKIRVQ